jgi:hypothetical protein
MTYVCPLDVPAVRGYEASRLASEPGKKPLETGQAQL